MSQQEREIRERFLEAKCKEEEARKEKSDCINELIALAPHKIGEIIEWTETNRKRNEGTSWMPRYKSLPDAHREAVLTRVSISEFLLGMTSDDDDIRYIYEFSPIKKDGDVSANSCHPQKDFTWTGIIHEKYKQQ